MTTNMFKFFKKLFAGKNKPVIIENNNTATIAKSSATPITVETLEVPTKQVQQVKYDSKGKNYKRSGKRGKPRSKGGKTDSGLSN